MNPILCVFVSLFLIAVTNACMVAVILQHRRALLAINATQRNLLGLYTVMDVRMQVLDNRTRNPGGAS